MESKKNRSSEISKRSSNKRKSLRNSSVLKGNFDFQQLEPRQLLAIAGVPVGNFNAGVTGAQQGWEFLWNAPDNWNSQSVGNLLTGSIEEVSSYRPLVKNSETGFWTADGNRGGSNYPANFAKLGAIGGAPGAEGIPNGFDRYSIASFTIDRTGMYSISNSHFALANNSIDGAEVRVHVNGEPVVLSKQIDKSNATIENETTNFDTTLGYLSKGDKVYVAFGAGNNQVRDFFFTDFTIFRTSAEIVVANFVDDFQTGAEPAGWDYLWNAPTGWNTSNSIGDLNSGSINDPSSFVPLRSSGSANLWTADADSSGTNHAPANFLRLGKGFGVPGAPANLYVQGEQSSSNLQAVPFQENLLDRYAITAYEVENSGHYAITESFIKTVNESNVDGVEVRVFVNDDPFLLSERSVGGHRLTFDTSLGFLAAGDTIYVAYGALSSQNMDFFQTDFSVTRILPRVEPLRSLENTRDFFVPAANSSDNFVQIGAAIDEARLYQENNPGAAVEIHLQPNQTYRISPTDTTRWASYILGDYYKDDVRYLAENIVFNGHGSTILIDNPTFGFMEIDHGKNIIIQDLEIDYVTLPFTQGTITNINTTANTIDLRIDASFAGSNFPSPLAPQFNGYDRSDFHLWGYAVKPNIPGQLTDGSFWHYATQFDDIVELGNGVFRMPLHITDGLKVTDRFVLQSRYSSAGAFSIYHESEQISIIGVKAYSGPGTFVAGNFNSAVNVIDSEVAIKPGRLKSINADAVHAQSFRFGPWVENSKFDGIGDDVSNFYTTPFTVLNQSLDRRTFVFGSLNTGGNEPADSSRNLPFGPSFAIGDDVTFYQTSSGEIIGNARVVNVTFESGRVTSVTLDQPIRGSSIEPKGLGSGNDTYLDDTTVYNNSLSSGFFIQGSEFKNSRRFGPYLMANRGQIVDSVFSGLSDQAIAGHNESAWPLGLFATDILIQGNQFLANGFSVPYQTDPQYTGTISFNMDRYTPNSANNLVDRNQTPFSNLFILDNQISDWRKAAISVRNLRNVEISGNEISSSLPHTAVDREFANQNTAIKVAWSDEIFVGNNQVNGLGQLPGFVETHLDVDEQVTNLIETGSVQVSAEDLVKSNSFEETTGRVVADQSAFSQSTIAIGAMRNVQGRIGSGIGFDGQNDFAFSQDNSPFADKSNRTIAMWIRPTNVADASKKQVIYEDGSVNSGQNIYLVAGKIYFGSWNSATGPGEWLSSSIVSNQWQHLAFTISDAGQMRAYVNGREVGSSNYSSHVTRFSSFIGLAAADPNGTRFHDGLSAVSSYSSHYLGRMDELRIYNRTLNSIEVASLALS